MDYKFNNKEVKIVSVLDTTGPHSNPIFGPEKETRQ
jgi:hypothetical protein